MSVLYSNSRIFVIPVYIFNRRKQTLVDTIGILSALRMRGLHDKRHFLAKLRICGSENWGINCPTERFSSWHTKLTCICWAVGLGGITGLGEVRLPDFSEEKNHNSNNKITKVQIAYSKSTEDASQHVTINLKETYQIAQLSLRKCHQKNTCQIIH